MTGPLELPPEDVRRLGYRVIDRVVAHWETLDEQPPVAIGQQGGYVSCDFLGADALRGGDYRDRVMPLIRIR